MVLPMAGLTPKQEKFALAYVETGNASEAYRRVYEAKTTSANSIHVTASNLLANPKVALRVAELQNAALEAHGETVASIAKLLHEDRAFARELETPAAAISASLGLAKLYGLLSDKHEHSGPNGGAVVHEVRIVGVNP